MLDLQAQRRRRREIDAAISRVLDHGQFILGPEVAALEAALSARSGGVEVVTCSSGTDALVMALMALGIGHGDAVLVPTFTFAATASAVELVGATPVFLDVVEASFNVDAAGVAPAALRAVRSGLRPAAIIAVDLFGQPADYEAITREARAAGLAVVADAAQSFGSTRAGSPVGTLADISTTSFFPTKPLGCYGDGGAVFTRDSTLADRMRSIRVHGQGVDKYHNDCVGMNGRLDTIQAAVLLEKLELFDDEVRVRQNIAGSYSTALRDVVEVPELEPTTTSVWAQYTIRSDRRPQLMERLLASGVPTAIYYPVPLHRQAAFRHLVDVDASFPVADRLAESVLSLPLHPYLEDDAQRWVVSAVREALAAG